MIKLLQKNENGEPIVQVRENLPPPENKGQARDDRKSDDYKKSHISNLIEPIEQDYDVTKTRTKAAEKVTVSLKDTARY